MKPGYQTTEFWLCLLAALQPALDQVIQLAPGQGWIPALVAAAYTLARAWAKSTAPAPAVPAAPADQPLTK